MAWTAAREQRFPRWAATYGAGFAWDFSPASLDVLAAVLFRVTPTPEHFDDPGYADFVDGATWYLGETLRRAEPAEWIAEHDDEYFRVRKHPDDEWSPAPRVDLRAAVDDGNPVRLHNVFGDWTTPFVAGAPPDPEYRWSGAAWRTPLHTWIDSIAGRVAALAAAVPHIALDYSAESLRRLEISAVRKARSRKGIWSRTSPPTSGRRCCESAAAIGPSTSRRARCRSAGLSSRATSGCPRGFPRSIWF